MKKIFICQDTLDGILTGVYDAWASRLGHENIRLAIPTEETLELFWQYQMVQTDAQKARKVFRTIEKRLGEDALVAVCRAAASDQPEKADAIYRMIVLGLSLERGSEIVNCLTYEPVSVVMKLALRTWHEAHHLMGFLRFVQLRQGILYADMSPKAQVLSFVAPHFADRFPREHWMIYDRTHAQAAIHQSGKGWFLVDTEGMDESVLAGWSADEQKFQDLWQCFHDTIAIESRVNPGLQCQMLPLRFRPHMTEFTG